METSAIGQSAKLSNAPKQELSAPKPAKAPEAPAQQDSVSLGGAESGEQASSASFSELGEQKKTESISQSAAAERELGSF